MALGAASIWEIRTAGSDSNGGGFNPGNANFPTDLAATSGTGTAPVLTSASYTFVAGDVDAYIFVKSGTNWTPGFYKIASVAAGAATVDASIGAVMLWVAASLLTANTVAGCATTASPTAGTFGVDYSQQDAAEFAFEDMIIDATTNTKFTSVLNPVGKNYVGNLIRVVSGAGFTVQTVEVVSTATITATCDKSLGTLGSTLGVGYLGGALLSPGMACGVAAANNQLYIKAGTYSITSTTNNVAGGRFTVPSSGGSTAAGGAVIGYNTTRSGAGTKPIIQASGISSATLITGVGTRSLLFNVEVDGASLATITGISAGNIRSCYVHHCVTGITSAVVVSQCQVSACGTGIISCTTVTGCSVTTCTTVGCNSNTYTGDCLVVGNTGAAVDGMIVSAGSSSIQRVEHCTVSGNGRHGISITGSAYYGKYVTDCIVSGNGGYGVNGVGITTKLIKIATYNNTSGAIQGTPQLNESQIVLTADPFTNTAGGDYSLNNTAGGGAACRAAGILGAFPNGTTTGYRDIGAVQHQDAGGGLIVSQSRFVTNIGTH